MNGTKVSFNRTGRSLRIRKTIPFDPVGDALILDYINERVRAGESFTSVVKELLLRQITLIQLAPTYIESTMGQTTPQTSQTTPQTDKLANPFDSLLT